MSGRGGGGGSNRKVLLPPINLIFRLLQSRALVTVWLYEHAACRVQGTVRGFDEFMNLVLDDAVEVKQNDKSGGEAKRRIGTVLLKGDTIALIQTASGS